MLADDIRELLEAKAASCSVGKMINDYEGDVRAGLINLIDKSKVSSTKITKLLASYGYEINPGMLNHHKRRISQTQYQHCKCPVEM